MFFPDKVTGYREARRVLGLDGRFVFSVWDRIAENEFTDVVTAAVAALTLLLTGVRKGYQWQERWTASSRAWVELRTLIESYQVEGTAIHGKRAELVERVNEVLKAETTSWAASLLSTQERG
jgi:hypothetical protein